MKFLMILIVLFSAIQVEAKKKVESKPKRTIQSIYSGFTKSCVALSYFEKKKDLENYINTVKEYAEGIPEKSLNKKIGENTDEEAQLKLFVPNGFYQAPKVIGLYLSCYEHLDGFIKTKTMASGLTNLANWKTCIYNIENGNSKEFKIASQVLECMKNPKK